LGTILKEARLIRQYRAHESPTRFDHDWAAIGYNRISLVNLLLSGTPDGDYLEIGCAGNDLFDSVMAARKVGVDPVRGGTHRQTSDDFFSAWRGGKFDVIFIDGLHTYEQVRRDLVNALAWLKPGGWIAMHDMLPRDWKEEHVPQIQSRGWTGDGWKCAFELAETPDIAFRLIAMDHGVAVLRPTQPGIVLADCRAELAPARFSYLETHRHRLPLVDWDEGLAWVRAGGP
ncbi:MAG: class I SAM-dependent methyltransferase, partial [Alphaproteobacteria bacterium]|nr:class I SAM-dependent methyltransferase [Alphaproteobacteria bacterium]